MNKEILLEYLTAEYQKRGYDFTFKSRLIARHFKISVQVAGAYLRQLREDGMVVSNTTKPRQHHWTTRFNQSSLNSR
jgi:predicted transcriptional regulator